jgi:hypothetical protein
MKERTPINLKVYTLKQYPVVLLFINNVVVEEKPPFQFESLHFLTVSCGTSFLTVSCGGEAPNQCESLHFLTVSCGTSFFNSVVVEEGPPINLKVYTF